VFIQALHHEIFKFLDHGVDGTNALHTTVNPSICNLSKYLKRLEIGYYGQVLHKLSQVSSGKETDVHLWSFGFTYSVQPNFLAENR